MSRLLKHLPPHERESNIIRAILKALEPELDLLGISITDFGVQLNIDTATWGLAIYEKELQLPIDPDLDLGTRRSLIKSRLMLRPPGSKSKLVELLKSFVETAEIEENYSEYTFDTVLKTRDSLGDKVQHIRNIIDIFKPAHLDYIFVICYLADILLSTTFQRWCSELLDLCGTRDVNERPYISTAGWTFRAGFLYGFNRWPSKILRASESTYPLGQGLRYSTMLTVLNGNYPSNRLAVCSLSTFSEGEGRTYKAQLLYTRQGFASDKIPVCSENTFVKEV
ncbi:MAG: DUF2313 domain-containing protein [Bacillota bacterium]|nr:DUF2313 domain-containing protein [Bacillota bacterium]